MRETMRRSKLPMIYSTVRNLKRRTGDTMEQVIKMCTSNERIGLHLRKVKFGPEDDIVQEFASTIADTFSSNSTNLAIFFEPQMETGFPDLVLVEYQLRIFDKWKGNRPILKKDDLKILQHLYNVGGARAKDIQCQLGLKSAPLLVSIERLLDAGMLRRLNNKWVPYSLKNTYAIKNITAIEAKISDLRTGIRQAEGNKWFASESYVLSPVQKPSNTTIRKFYKSGVGVYSIKKNHITRILPSAQVNLPSCLLAPT